MATYPLNSESPDAERRYAGRHDLSLGLRAWSGKTALELRAHDLSQTGFLAADAPFLRLGETLEVELPHQGRNKATVVWQNGSLNGCTFEKPISKGALSAALLKSDILKPREASKAETDQAAVAAGEVLEEEKLPVPTRLRTIVIAGSLPWVAIIAALALVLA